MNIINFVKSLLPRIEKDEVLEDLRVTTEELDQVVGSNYQHASDFFRSNKFRSEENKDLQDFFYRKFNIKGSKQSNFVSEIARCIPFLKENVTYLRAQVEELMERDIISEGLTAKKAVLVRASKHLSFISMYAGDLLNVIYVNEASAVGADVEESMRLAPAVTKRVDQGMASFAAFLSDYGIPNREFQKLIASIPDVVISSRTENSIVSMYKEKDIDPFTSPYVAGFSGNPIYHFRLVIAEWQTARYKSKRELKRMLELRLLHLKLLQEKKNDPKIENEINYIQGRVDKIERHLREMEDSVKE